MPVAARNCRRFPPSQPKTGLVGDAVRSAWAAGRLSWRKQHTWPGQNPGATGATPSLWADGDEVGDTEWGVDAEESVMGAPAATCAI